MWCLALYSLKESLSLVYDWRNRDIIGNRKIVRVDSVAFQQVVFSIIVGH